MKRFAQNLKKAFSLPEVTIALGIIGFCAIAVMGLLPVAVQTHRRGHDQSYAAAILGNFFAGFQAPTTNAASQYLLGYPFTNIGWTTNGTIVGSASGSAYFDADGNYTGTTSSTNARYRLNYSNLSAPTSTNAGAIYAGVSWPAGTNATPRYQGTLEGTIYFTSPVP